MRDWSRRHFLAGAGTTGLPATGASFQTGGRPSEIREILETTPLGDTHEHIFPEEQRLAMQLDVFSLFLSAYSGTDLRSVGIPSAVADQRLPLAERWKLFAPYWEKTRNTGYLRAVEIALRDLFGAEELTESTCEEISERIRRANRRGVTERILRDRCRIKFAVLDDKLPEPAMPELELFSIARRFDRFILATARNEVLELERATGSAIGSLGDLEKALEKDFAKNLERTRMVAVKSTLAYHRTLFFRKSSREEAERDFERVMKGLPPPGDDSFARVTDLRAKDLQDYMFHRLVRLAGEHRIPFQVHTGLQAGRNVLQNANPLDLTNLFHYYPDVRFDLFHSGYPYLTEAAALVKMFPNVSVDMCWMHAISPAAARRILHEYLDTVPSTKVLGFGGDCNLAEIAYGYSVIARDNVIRVLEARVAEGISDPRSAVAIGKRVLCDNAEELFLKPRSG
jgi:predicted TIM-barrel fold metal-dependent hydrolase